MQCHFRPALHQESQELYQQGSRCEFSFRDGCSLSRKSDDLPVRMAIVVRVAKCHCFILIRGVVHS